MLLSETRNADYSFVVVYSFWDDWLRLPEQRKNRQCIRPEISRVYTFGSSGTSGGQFFAQYLEPIVLNDKFVPFTTMDMSYLLKVRTSTDCSHASERLQVFRLSLSPYTVRAFFKYHQLRMRFTCHFCTTCPCHVGPAQLVLVLFRKHDLSCFPFRVGAVAANFYFFFSHVSSPSVPSLL